MLEAPLTPISLDELRMKLAKKSDVFQQSEGFPVRWKSLASGTTKIVRRDGDRIYVETILPEAAKQAGCFTLADLKKQGDVYSGNVKHNCICQYYDKWRRVNKTNRVSEESPFEISTLSLNRIEGWSMAPPKDATYDCAKGSYTKPLIHQPFVWIPE
jgi:hypothetical protein